MEETSHSLDETSHILARLPEKVALADIVEAIAACRTRALSARAATIPTVPVLYALIDPKRRNGP